MNSPRLTSALFVVLVAFSTRGADVPSRAADSPDPESVTQSVRTALDDMHSDARGDRQAAVDRLVRLGLPVLPHLRRAMAGLDDNHRRGAIEVVTRLGPAAIPLVSDWCSSGSPRLRAAVIRAVGSMHPPVTARTLLTIFESCSDDVDPDSLFEALWLSRSDGAESCAHLAAIDAGDTATRRSAAALALLAQCRSPELGDGRLADVLGSTDPRAPVEALRQTWRSGLSLPPRSCSVMFQLLRRNDFAVVRWTRSRGTTGYYLARAVAATLIARRTASDSCEALHLPDGSDEQSLLLASMLRWRSRPSSSEFPVSVDHLRALPRDVRLVAAEVVRAAAEACDARTLTLLAALLGDEDWLVRRAAAGEVPPGVSLSRWARARILTPTTGESEADGLAHMLGTLAEAEREWLLAELARRGLADRQVRLRYAAADAASTGSD